MLPPVCESTWNCACEIPFQNIQLKPALNGQNYRSTLVEYFTLFKFFQNIMWSICVILQTIYCINVFDAKHSILPPASQLSVKDGRNWDLSSLYRQASRLGICVKTKTRKEVTDIWQAEEQMLQPSIDRTDFWTLVRCKTLLFQMIAGCHRGQCHLYAETGSLCLPPLALRTSF